VSDETDSVQEALTRAHSPVEVTLERWRWARVETLIRKEAERERAIAKRSKWETTKQQRERSATSLEEAADAIAEAWNPS